MMVRANLLALLLILAMMPAVAPAGPAVTFQGDPQAITEVKTAYDKFAAARTWRARMNITGSGTTTTSVVEIADRDRRRITMTAGGQTTEITVIGEEMWMRGGGGCFKPPTRIRVPDPREGVEHGADSKVTVARGAPESVEGTATRTYLLTIESQGKTVRQRLFVAIATDLPRRVEMPSDQGSMTIDYYDFGAPITVAPPC